MSGGNEILRGAVQTAALDVYLKFAASLHNVIKVMWIMWSYSCSPIHESPYGDGSSIDSAHGVRPDTVSWICLDFHFA